MKIEQDEVAFRSGMYHALILGSPIMLEIENRDWQNWQVKMTQISSLPIEKVGQQSVSWIWHESPMFNHLRGGDWMPEPSQGRPRKTIDFGGCRCQAFQLTGDAPVADLVCQLSPHQGSWRKLPEL